MRGAASNRRARTPRIPDPRNLRVRTQTHQCVWQSTVPGPAFQQTAELRPIGTLRFPEGTQAKRRLTGWTATQDDLFINYYDINLAPCSVDIGPELRRVKCCPPMHYSRTHMTAPPLSLLYHCITVRPNQVFLSRDKCVRMIAR